jgi:hypothetical protein
MSTPVSHGWEKEMEEESPSPSPSYVWIPAKEKPKLIKRVESGESIAQVAADYKITPRHVSRIVAGLPGDGERQARAPAPRSAATKSGLVPISSRSRGLSATTRDLISFAYDLLAESHPMTLRQLHYAIFSFAGVHGLPYANTPADYKRLSRATTTARRNYRNWELEAINEHGPDIDCLDFMEQAHEERIAEKAGETCLYLPNDGCLIPPGWMVDETRQLEIASMWRDKAAFADSIESQYRHNKWESQPRHIEVWSEKATVLGSLRPVTDQYSVGIRVCHGFGSAGMEHDVGQSFAETGRKKLIHVFYVGDHDPSGHSIERDIHRRCTAAAGVTFDMVRLAIHATDIADFNLPPQTVKQSDSRAAGFRHVYGDDAATVELDALPVVELRRRVGSAIRELIDQEQWDHEVEIEAVQRASIMEFTETLRRCLRD